MIRTILVVSLLVGSVWTGSTEPVVMCTTKPHRNTKIEFVEKYEEHCEYKCEKDCKDTCYDYFDVECEPKVVQNCTRQEQDDECWDVNVQTCKKYTEEKCHDVTTYEERAYVVTDWVQKRERNCDYNWMHDEKGERFWGINLNSCQDNYNEVAQNRTAYKKVPVVTQNCTDEHKTKRGPPGVKQICKKVPDIKCKDITYYHCMKVKKTKCEKLEGMVDKADCVTMHTRVPMTKEIIEQITVCGEIEDTYSPK